MYICSMTDKNKRSLIAFLPIAVLVAVLAADIAIFGADSILGASQVALMLAGGVCIGLAMLLYKTPWNRFEDSIKRHVGDVASAILILLLIGAISGTWTASGVVPAFIYYGLKIISPNYDTVRAGAVCNRCSFF